MMEWIGRLPLWLWVLLVAFGVINGAVAYLILLERKIASWVQDRIGPNRVGPYGLLQPMADGLKFVLKEDYRAAGTDKILFTIAPIIMMTVIIISMAVIPWGGVLQRTATVAVPSTQPAVVAKSLPIDATITQITPAAEHVQTVTYTQPFQIANLNIGVLFLIAMLSLAVYGVVFGGWASNNKYSFLGGLRATAQMFSYEIPLGLSILAIITIFGTLELGTIVEKQAHYWFGFIPAWNVFAQPLTFLLFLICIHAEANRAPFDLAEAEQELVGGYHTEYSSMRFALFFLAEYTGMIITSAVCVALFFGGWHVPWLEWLWPALGGNVDPASPALTTSLIACIVRAAVYFVKTMVIIFLFMWVRWSLPRFRFDQLLMLAWRALIPISLAILLASAIVIYEFQGGPVKPGQFVSTSMAIALLASNIGILIIAMILSRFLPAPPATNRRLPIQGSRFQETIVSN